VIEGDRVSACRSCGARVIWATSEKSGKALPIDVERVPFRGSIVLRHEVAGEPPVAHYTSKDERAALKAAHERSPEEHRPFALFQSHFASCPSAARWRTGPPAGTTGR